MYVCVCLLSRLLISPSCCPRRPGHHSHPPYVTSTMSATLTKSSPQRSRVSVHPGSLDPWTGPTRYVPVSRALVVSQQLCLVPRAMKALVSETPFHGRFNSASLELCNHVCVCFGGRGGGGGRCVTPLPGFSPIISEGIHVIGSIFGLWTQEQVSSHGNVVFCFEKYFPWQWSWFMVSRCGHKRLWMLLVDVDWDEMLVAIYVLDVAWCVMCLTFHRLHVYECVTSLSGCLSHLFDPLLLRLNSPTSTMSPRMFVPQIYFFYCSWIYYPVNH